MIELSHPPITDGKKISTLSGVDLLSNGVIASVRASMPAIGIATKYGAVGYALHELGKQSHVVNAIESFGVGIITWMGTPFANLYEQGLSSESVASLLIV